ncbi:MAG: hypothetical protein O9972_39605 [Burkholderiales bacterium]|nr:hypothetical protein [Burkholderiales bacterium]
MTTAASKAAKTTAAAADKAPAATEPAAETRTLRGYLIERKEAGGPSSFFTLTSTPPGWTWDREKATVFEHRDDAKVLLAKKREVDGRSVPAGPASGEGAKIVKADAGADDE